MDISSSVTRILDIPPSAIAFSPTHPELFAVGTYFLHPSTGEQDDATQKRTGSLMLWRLEGTQVTLLETTLIESAVLDLEWTPHTSSLGETVCVATSTGSLLFYALDAKQGTLVRTSEKNIAEPSTLVLDLLWHPRRPDVIAVTLSDGNVSLCQSTGGARNWDEGSSVQVREVASHGLEPWTLAFAPGSEVVFSGGDDAVLQAINLPNSTNEEGDGAQDEGVANVKWTDRRIHQAGVTSILPLTDHLVVTGSYDDHIRLLYAPPVGRRQVLAELNLGGGVWRTKMLTSSQGDEDGKGSADRSYIILASCMHAGSCVVRLLCRRGTNEAEVQWEFEVLARFEEHESMNYGSDVQPLSHDGKSGEKGGLGMGTRTVVSTSFYDKRLCVWQVDLPGRL